MRIYLLCTRISLTYAYFFSGIIRNIDETKQLFYILTPEPVERLKNVNALLKGSAQLPTTYFSEVRTLQFQSNVTTSDGFCCYYCQFILGLKGVCVCVCVGGGGGGGSVGLEFSGKPVFINIPRVDFIFEKLGKHALVLIL